MKQKQGNFKILSTPGHTFLPFLARCYVTKEPSVSHFRIPKKKQFQQFLPSILKLAESYNQTTIH